MVRRVAPLLSVVVFLGALGYSASRGLAWVEAPLDGCHPQVSLQFGKAAECAIADPLGAFHDSLGRDCIFALMYGFVLGLLARLLPEQTRRDARLDWIEVLSYGGAAAAGLDVLENCILPVITEVDGNVLSTSGAVGPPLVTAIAIVKWASLGLGLWVMALRVGNLTWPRAKIVDADDDGVKRPEPPDSGVRDLAVCCSGGGIRSAAFSLGVLHALDGAGLSGRVHTIAAISGGNYAATAWRLQQLDTPDRPASEVIKRLLQRDIDPLAEAVAPLALDAEGGDGGLSDVTKGWHRYLLNGPGGLPAAGWLALGAVALNLLQVLLVLEVIGYPLGRLIVAPPFHDALPSLLDEGKALTIRSNLTWPLVVFAVGALAILLGSAAIDPGKAQRAAIASAGGLLAMAMLFAVTIIVLPWTLAQIGGPGLPVTIGGISVIAVAGAIARMFSDPLRRAAPRLGGVALAALFVIVLGFIAHEAALAHGPFGSQWMWQGSVATVLLLTYGVDTQTWSLREMYRNRLANSFVIEDRQPGSLWKRIRRKPGHQGITWADLAEAGPPELVVCCAASRVGLQPNGSPADSFTISQSCVWQHDATHPIGVPTGDYVKTLNGWALGPLRSPAGWMATSGAAFASAMGGMSLGSTNALLAALNVDLGIWLPAPGKVDVDGRVRTSFPPVGLGKLVNEIYGLYSERDDMVFVTDGGHVENLGLVELLRDPESPIRKIVCIDASQDATPGSFAALRRALRQVDAVRSEDRLWFDLTELDNSTLPARTSAYRIPVRHWSSRKPWGTIYYAKLQAATDQPLEMRKYANVDPRFPNYSTANQLLTDQQFSFLLLAGQTAGRRICELIGS